MSIFPTKILLATDASEEAELARRTAVDMTISTKSTLHLVTVTPGYPSYDVNVPNVVEQLREQAEKILDEQAEKVEREGATVAEKHLRACLVKVRVKPFWRSLAYAEDLSNSSPW